MYADVINAIDEFTAEADKWRIDPDFDPKPEWFAQLSCYNLGNGVEYLGCTIFDTLLWEMHEVDGTNYNKIFDEVKRNDFLDQLNTAFIREHEHAEEVTDSILSYLHELRTHLENDDASRIEDILQLINEESYTYERLRGMCYEFMNELPKDNRVHKEFWSGIYGFPTIKTVSDWTKYIYNVFVNTAE